MRSPFPIFLGLGAIVLLIAASSGKPKSEPTAATPHPAAPQRPDVVVLLDFGGKWCGPCCEMEPTVAKLEGEGVSVEKIDPRKDKAAASKWNVTATPCFIATRNGKEFGRHVGACSIDELRRLVGKPAAKAEVTKPVAEDAKPEPPKLATGPKGWRLRLFYPHGSTRGEALKAQITRMKMIADKYGFAASTTDEKLFKPWSKQLSADEVTLVLVAPNDDIVYQESANIPSDPIAVREALRESARASWKAANEPKADKPEPDWLHPVNLQNDLQPMQSGGWSMGRGRR